MNQFIVAKFGGTSVANVEAMKKSASIAKNENAQIVVVSATSGTTNKLIEIMKLAEEGKKNQALDLSSQVIGFHQQLAKEINLSDEKYNSLDIIFSEIESMTEGFSLLKEVSPKARDYFVGQGERMSSILFHSIYQSMLGQECNLLDSREFIKTDSLFGKGTPQLAQIKDLCSKLKPSKFYVAQGFIASDLNGIPTILGRGGSDYSAALFAYGVNAKELQIWTDVSGIATVDPRLYAKAKPIHEITFAEASELASFGAKVLHPRTLIPLWNSKTQICVKNTMAPQDRGTVIKVETSETPYVRGIAVKRKQNLITLTNPNMLHNYGFLASVFSLFDQHHVSVDTVITSEISISLTLDEADLLSSNLIEDLSKICNIKQESNLSLISMIGNHLNITKGLANEVFGVLKNYNIRLINQGASQHNFCFMISDDQTSEVVSALHSKFLD